MNALSVIAVSVAATYIWRAIGVWIAGAIHADSLFIRYASCVAYAIVTALIGRMIIFPTGTASMTSLTFRLLATAIGLIVFFIAKRSVVAGAWAGSIMIILLNFLYA